ncbi:ABC transporter substrate-binding protein [Variovorax ginsengisoli]|uniref:ABC transporter substrate-binding protein n=1 Tax=Variovorax ginsengisoli TaxID=363844 RepID=A0ABT8SHY8_9BURK|nr:ABC transporter substrate-binding protein [Variovorax ginsengisoli]MDN8618824.1 ABC transporter substrate-binding protein [Variovorax ginsengisoli]MDO1537994.1 ABC transporter substrate-binding protein [Variovorax ginsengisoli]
MHTLRLLWFVPSPLSIAAEAWNLTSGVALRAERNPSSDAQFEALASGDVDAVVTAMDNVMDWNLRAGPKDLRVIAQLESTTPLTLVGQRGRTELEGLRGATILVDAPRNGFVVALRAMLAQRGIDSDAYSLETVGGVKERFDALGAGRGDATLLGPPFDAMALEAGLSRLASVQALYPAFPGQGLVASARTVDRLRPALLTWLGALDRARQRMSEDPNAARQALALAGFPAPAVEATLRTTAASLCPDRLGVELLIEQRRMAGLSGADTTYEELVDTSVLPRD